MVTFDWVPQFCANCLVPGHDCQNCLRKTTNLTHKQVIERTQSQAKTILQKLATLLLSDSLFSNPIKDHIIPVDANSAKVLHSSSIDDLVNNPLNLDTG